MTGWTGLTTMAYVEYRPSAAKDQPRSPSPARKPARPAEKATAPGRIAAAGTIAGAR